MNFQYENKKIKLGFTHVIGCDEVGRGCLAGPVVAAAVLLSVESGKLKVIKSAGVRDSKLLGAEKREELSGLIKENCVAWGIGVVDEKVIDKINIHHATLAAMKLAVEQLMCHCEGVQPTEAILLSADKKIAASPAKVQAPRNDRYFLSIDGKFIIPSFASNFAKASSDEKASEDKSNFNIEQEAVVDGDNKILSIAAASIIAKVYRDDLMRKFDKQYSVYGFAKHKGYATEYHRGMISEHGLTPIHRLTFCSAFLPLPLGEGRGEGLN